MTLHRARRRRGRRRRVRCCPRSASPLGSAIFERPAGAAGSRSARPTTSRTTPTSRGHHDRRRASARSARRRSTCARATPKIDEPPSPPGTTSQFIAISTRCMHLGCPVRFVEAAERFICPCHGGVYDFHGQRRPAARRCARSTASTPASATASSRSGRATRSTPSSSASRSYRDPGQDARRHRPVPPADDASRSRRRCMHLGCPVRFVEASAALHLPVPRRRLRLRAARSPAARRCARSTASTPACATASVEVGPRYSVNSELKRFPPRDPGEALDGIGQYLYPSASRRPKLPGT